LFLRDAGSLGSACAHDVLVDGEKVFAIRAGEYQALFLAPGQHSFIVEITGGLCGAFSKKHSTVLRDGAEETYRILIPSLTSGPFVEIVSTNGADAQEVPGTRADARVQLAVRIHLSNIEREAHDEECEFDVVKAQPYRLDELSNIGKADPEGEKLDRRLRREGKVHVEKWTVRSCGTLKDYEVIMINSPDGGTEISAAPIEPASSAETALDASSAATGLDKGRAAHRRGDYDTAFRELLPLAEQGVAEAQLGVGVMYSDGQGVAADPSEAVKWLRRAAEQGLADAQLSLANMYFLGRQIPGDPAEAVRWYRRAAEQGHPQAQFSLASMYSVGSGVAQDYVLAYMWCTVSDAGSGARRCDRVADKMTKEQVARARELASKFVPRPERSARSESGTIP
jgi:hypothetical protein